MEEHRTQGRRRSSAKARRRRRRKIKLLIRRIVFCVALLVFIFSIVMLVKTLIGYGKADKIYNKVEDAVFSGTYKPDFESSTPQPEAQTSSQNTSETTSGFESSATITTDDDVLLKGYNHDSLLDINSDSVGYLQIPGLDLLLPIVQGTDNNYYLSHAITGASSDNGTLFIDYRNTDGIKSQNVIVYGHNMKDGSMFGTLDKFLDEDFYSKDNNRFFYFYLDGKILKYEIYSVHITPSVSNAYTLLFNNNDEFTSYINSMNSLSAFSTNVPFNENSQSITLSTCTDDNPDTRVVVHALKVAEISQ